MFLKCECIVELEAANYISSLGLRPGHNVVSEPDPLHERSGSETTLQLSPGWDADLTNQNS